MCVLYAILVFISLRKISSSNLLKLLVVSLLFVYLFGVLGSVRVGLLLDLPYEQAEGYILSAGAASDAFKKLVYRSLSFWGWLYLCSPLYNFIYNVDSVGLLRTPGLGY